MRFQAFGSASTLLLILHSLPGFSVQGDTMTPTAPINQVQSLDTVSGSIPVLLASPAGIKALEAPGFDRVENICVVTEVVNGGSDPTGPPVVYGCSMSSLSANAVHTFITPTVSALSHTQVSSSTGFIPDRCSTLISSIAAVMISDNISRCIQMRTSNFTSSGTVKEVISTQIVTATATKIETATQTETEIETATIVVAPGPITVTPTPSTRKSSAVVAVNLGGRVQESVLAPMIRAIVLVIRHADTGMCILRDRLFGIGFRL